MELSLLSLLLFCAFNVGQCGLFGVPSLGYKILTFDPDPLKNDPDPKVLSCYYNVPTMYDRPFSVFPEQIDPFLCTHINVAFARIVNSTLLPGADRDVEFYNRTIKLKEKNPKLKVLISVGGASSSGDKSFASMMATNVSRIHFIQSAIAFMDSYGFDGLDVDWEFPVVDSTGVQENPREKTEFSSFFKEFRKKADNSREHGKYVLTAAVGALKATIDSSYDIPEIARSLDYINLMTYDFHYYATDTPFTGPNSPLRSISSEFGYFTTMNTEWAAKYWNTKGMPLNKIVLGMPTYGRTYSLVDERYHGYYDVASGVATVGSSNGYVSRPEACAFLSRNGTVQVLDPDSLEPYAYNGKDWITIANEQSAIEKALLVNAMGFLGISVYSINSDDAWKSCNSSKQAFPIIQAARETLQIRV